jgi:mannose-6-phosphate isomerase-like protein (cupin superfamily)
MSKEDMTVNKPWGKEVILYKGQYAVKYLHVNKGHKTSYQYHKRKVETMLVLQGKMKLTYGTLDKDFGFHDIIHIPKMTLHRLEALEDTIIYEVSTPELDDVVRVQDDYKRIKK